MSQLKIALLLALVVVFLCLSAADAARQLLDDFDNCHQGWGCTHYLSFHLTSADESEYWGEQMRDGWRRGGYRGDFYCDGRHWDRGGGYYYGNRYYGPGDRGGFININVGK